jgi:hypothetical protein
MGSPFRVTLTAHLFAATYIVEIAATRCSHRTIGPADFSVFASHTRIADHAFLALMLAETAAIVLK